MIRTFNSPTILTFRSENLILTWSVTVSATLLATFFLNVNASRSITEIDVIIRNQNTALNEILKPKVIKNRLKQYNYINIILFEARIYILKKTKN